MSIIEVFLGALSAVFVGLKLAGFIHWSWWFVFMPLYGVFVLFLFAALMIDSYNGASWVSNSIGSFFSRKKKMNEIMESFENSQKQQDRNIELYYWQ